MIQNLAYIVESQIGSGKLNESFRKIDQLNRSGWFISAHRFTYLMIVQLLTNKKLIGPCLTHRVSNSNGKKWTGQIDGISSDFKGANRSQRHKRYLNFSDQFTSN